MPEEKLPPQNIEAEQATLGAVLLDPDAIIKVADILTPPDFYRPDHATIYGAMLELYEDRMPIDLVTLTDRLEKKKKLKQVGGAAYLTNLVNAVSSSAHVAQYAELVQQKSTLRKLITASTRIIEDSYKEAEDVPTILDRAEQSLFSVSERYLREAFIPIREILGESFERIDELHKNKGKLRGIGSGFRGIDNLLAGFQKSDLIILAARPSMGKTSLALNVAINASIVEKIPVGVFSLEMSRDQLVDRLLTMEAGIDSWKLRTGNLADEDFPKLNRAMGELSEAPLYIDDSPLLGVMEMRTKARRLQAEHGLGLLIVDYLQLMEGRTRHYSDISRVQEVSDISRALKALARELNIPVLAVSQLSRAVEARSPKIPQLSDLRESGCLTGDTLVFSPTDGRLLPIKELVGKQSLVGLSLNEQNKLIPQRVARVFPTGRKKVFELRLASGKRIKATANHKFLTIDDWKRLDELTLHEKLATASSNVSWEEVVAITPRGFEEVYDMTVPLTHNFVANSIIVHNSLEQDSDVVMFIYREDYYEPETDKKGIAQIIIRKHRNGPTGEVELYFHPQYSRFANLEKERVEEPEKETELQKIDEIER